MKLILMFALVALPFALEAYFKYSLRSEREDDEYIPDGR